MTADVQHTYLQNLKYVCAGILHIQLYLYKERHILFNIMSLSHMNEHMLKLELFYNQRITVKWSTLD